MKSSQKTVVVAMSYSRKKWIDTVAGFLAGIIGEYAKLKMAALVDYPHNWEPEVKRLVKKLETFIDPSRVATNPKGLDRKKAFLEAAADASVRDDKVTQAKNAFAEKLGRKSTLKFLKRYSDEGQNFDAENLLVEVLERYSPTLYGIISSNK